MTGEALILWAPLFLNLHKPKFHVKTIVGMTDLEQYFIYMVSSVWTSAKNSIKSQFYTEHLGSPWYFEANQGLK